MRGNDVSGLISVAMTTYNGEKYLEQQIESILSQTLPPDEIIIVDDCSMDGTRTILERYSQANRLKYYVNPERMGINSNFSRAISLCKGDFIALCDQDDVWLPNKLEEMVSAGRSIPMESPGLVVSDLYLVDAEMNSLRKFRPSKLDNWIYSLFGSARQGCCMMMNRALADLVVPIPDCRSLRNNYDYFISIVAVMCGVKVKLDRPLMYYRLHGSNAVGKAYMKRNNILSRTLRLYTQQAYDYSMDSLHGGLRAVYEARGNSFRKDRVAAFWEVIEVIEARSFFQKAAKICLLGHLDLWGKMKIMINSLILIFLQKIKGLNRAR